MVATSFIYCGFASFMSVLSSGLSSGLSHHLVTHVCPVPGGQLYLNEFGNPHGPLVLVLGGISGGRSVWQADGSGWWQELFKVVDLQRFGVLAVDYAGGTGDSQVLPVAATITQQAQLIAAALVQLGLTQLHTVIGGSYGGLVALELAQHKSLSMSRLAVIGAAHRAPAQAVMLRYFQRQLLRLGDAAGEPEQGLQLARALAMLSYRSSAAMDQYFPDPQQAVTYIERKGQQLVQADSIAARNLFEQFGPALDSYRLTPQLIHQPTLLIGFTSDQLVPAELLTEFAEQLPHCVGLHCVESSYGHDGFIKSVSAYAAPLQQFLAAEVGHE
jgi:homoserine O-acetyltransferase/O-succinyltransferase